MPKIMFILCHDLTTAPMNANFGMHAHNSPRYSISSLNLTREVIRGHWRSLEVSCRVTNEAKTQKLTNFRQNLFGNFYSIINFLSNGIQYVNLFGF